MLGIWAFAKYAFSMIYDYAIVGSGIVGLGCGLQLKRRFPQARIAILEKEASPAQHQTGHNSGVLHSGIYYRPGSLKANLSRRGLQLMVQFCREHSISHEICGKVIVATDEQELPRLKAIAIRAQENGLKDAVWLESDAVRLKEPHVKAAAGIWVRETGIVDYVQVCEKIVQLLKADSVDFYFGSEVLHSSEKKPLVLLKTQTQELLAQKVIFCSGLQSDRMAKQSFISKSMDLRIIPFRGEYYKVKAAQAGVVRNLVYPVPNPELPFLGVHLTRMIHGGLEAGPSAVLSLKRECYGAYGFNLQDALDTFTWPGFYKIAWRYMGVGAEEVLRTLSRRAFCRAAQKLVPDLQEHNLEFAFAGVRAQAVSRRGELLDDFVILKNQSTLHVCNAPSPAATSSLAIGEYLVNLLQS